MAVFLIEGVSLESIGPFRPGAVYCEVTDWMVYLAEDATAVSERVDDYLWKLWAGCGKARGRLIGFRLECFRSRSALGRGTFSVSWALRESEMRQGHDPAYQECKAMAGADVVEI
jgi:hypothetical protein